MLPFRHSRRINVNRAYRLHVRRFSRGNSAERAHGSYSEEARRSIVCRDLGARLDGTHNLLAITDRQCKEVRKGG